MPATLTMMDGTTFQKEFPAWVTTSPKTISTSNKKREFSQALSGNENIYYETLKPIFFVLTITGVLPIFKPKIGSHKLQIVLMGGVCLTMYLLIAYFTYIVTVEIVRLIFNDDDFNSIIIQVASMMLLMQHVFYLVLSWPESLAVNRYFGEWKHFQTRFEHVCQSRLTLTCQRKVIVLIVFSAVLCGGYMLASSMVETYGYFTNIMLSVLGYHLFIQVCFYILWFSNSWAVTEAAQQYNAHLTKECMMDITADKLEEYRLLWMRLTEIVRSGSSMLSYTMAVMVTTPFAFEVIAAYNLTMFVIRTIRVGDTEELYIEALTTALLFVFYAILIYMFCNSGHYMTVNCEKIQDVLLTLKPRSPPTAAKVNSELRLFLRCLRSVPPCATLSGYVTISRKVFLHLTGVLVTYLIILVQFNISSLHENNSPATKRVKPTPTN